MGGEGIVEFDPTSYTVQDVEVLPPKKIRAQGVNPAPVFP